MLTERDVQRSDPLEIDNALAALFPAKVIDENALTSHEVAEKTGLGRSQAARKMQDAVVAGTWEQVFKHADSGRLSKAYRPKK